MNKVISIEIASQVFWVDEDAYEILQSYLKIIRQQLVDDECAKEIFKDIELRVAELLYALNTDEKKAVIAAQMNEVVEQVGLIDSEEPETELPRKSYLDPQNKILGGVCAGLAVRFGVSAFILRLVFIGLTAVFGLGVVLYLIFWISLDTNSNRNAALAAQGKARTAKQIATFEVPKEHLLTRLQRLIFLPFSIIGTLISVFVNHFINRRKGYLFIIKSVVALALIIAAILLCVGIFTFNQNRLFVWPVAWLISVAVMYLIVLVLATYVRQYYISRPLLKVKKPFVLGALVPIVVVVAAIGYFAFVTAEHADELIEKRFALDDTPLSIELNDEHPLDQYARHIRYRVMTSASAANELVLKLEYYGEGTNKEVAKQNIHVMDYFYSFNDNTLNLDEFWTLKKGELNRGQYLSVLLEVPQNTLVVSSWPLRVDEDGQLFKYRITGQKPKETVYFASGQYLHEYGDEFANKLSRNERDILNKKFCKEYFMSETWGCVSNIRTHESRNSRFDQAFSQDIESIDKIREHLQPDRTIFVSNLVEINELVEGLSIEYPVMSEFQAYIEQLLRIKNMQKPEIILSPD